MALHHLTEASKLVRVSGLLGCAECIGCLTGNVLRVRTCERPRITGSKVFVVVHAVLYFRASRTLIGLIMPSSIDLPKPFGLG